MRASRTRTAAGDTCADARDDDEERAYQREHQNEDGRRSHEEGPSSEEERTRRPLPGLVREESTADVLLRVLEMHEEGDIDLKDLVAPPRPLLALFHVFFGVVWRGLPLSAILGTTLAIGASINLFANVSSIVTILVEGYHFLALDVELYLGFFKQGLSCACIVDIMVVSHGLLVGAYTTHNFLCGPRGKLTCCREQVDSQAAKRDKGCSCLSLLLRLIAAVGRGVFAVAAVLLLWLSLALLLCIAFTCAFNIIVLLPVELGCQRLQDTSNISMSPPPPVLLPALFSLSRWNPCTIPPYVQRSAPCRGCAFAFLPEPQPPTNTHTHTHTQTQIHTYTRAQGAG